MNGVCMAPGAGNPGLPVGVLQSCSSHELGVALLKVSGQAIRDVLVSFISVSSDQRPAKIRL